MREQKYLTEKIQLMLGTTGNFSFKKCPFECLYKHHVIFDDYLLLYIYIYSY